MKEADAECFLSMADALNLGKKYIVAKYIVEHKNSDGTLIITNRELAKRCGVGIIPLRTRLSCFGKRI